MKLCFFVRPSAGCRIANANRNECPLLGTSRTFRYLVAIRCKPDIEKAASKARFMMGWTPRLMRARPYASRMHLHHQGGTTAKKRSSPPPLLGISYDPKDDVIDIALEGVDHMIHKHHEIYVEENGLQLSSLEVVDGEAARQIVVLRDQLMLPAPAQSAAKRAATLPTIAGARGVMLKTSRDLRGAFYWPAGVTRQTVFPTSSAISRAPDLSMASPTGRPRAFSSEFRKPVTTSSALPVGRPPLNGTKTTL
jgi:hypothetical protein